MRFSLLRRARFHWSMYFSTIFNSTQNISGRCTSGTDVNESVQAPRAEHALLGLLHAGERQRDDGVVVAVADVVQRKRRRRIEHLASASRFAGCRNSGRLDTSMSRLASCDPEPFLHYLKMYSETPNTSWTYKNWTPLPPTSASSLTCSTRLIPHQILESSRLGVEVNR